MKGKMLRGDGGREKKIKILPRAITRKYSTSEVELDNIVVKYFES